MSAAPFVVSPRDDAAMAEAMRADCAADVLGSIAALWPACGGNSILPHAERPVVVQQIF